MAENQISDALKMIPYGFYAVGSRHEKEKNLMVLNWFTQASFEPQLVAIALQKSSFTYGLVEKSGMFVVNILGVEDQNVISAFTKSRNKNPQKLEGAAYSAGPKSGAPVLDAAVAYMECRVRNTVESGGDHNLILAEVINAEVRKAGDASQTLNLVKMGWSYAG